MTGADVISFGQAGAGSIYGIIINPIEKFRQFNSSWLYHLEIPSILIVYFYEGNDLNENLRSVRKHLGSDIKSAHARIENFVEKKYHEATTREPPNEEVYAAKFFWALIEYNLGWDKKLRKEINKLRQEALPGSTNKALVGGTTIALPDELQSPGLELSDDELHIGMEAFEAALARLHRFFPEARLIVTIIPAPLSAYQLVSNTVLIKSYEGNRSSLYPAAQVSLRSNQICELVAAASRRVGAEFFDVRGSIRSAARSQLIHGPQDWRHFNKQGYTELGKSVSAYLEQPIRGGEGCVLLE